MQKRACVLGLSLLCLMFLFTAPAFSSGHGPEQLTLTSSDSSKKSPAVFPHAKHQEAFSCGDCHHSMADDGKQKAYTEGMEIESCETCHNEEKLAGKREGRYKLDSFKGAAHGSCLECHKKVAKEDSSKRKLRSCNTCHVKS